MSTDTYTPEVLWAQRSSATDPEANFIYLTLVVPDVAPSAAEITLKSDSVAFKGFSDTLKRTYKVELALYGEIDETASKVNHTSRAVELKLVKKELKEEYWPRLLKDTKKSHFLKTDFDKWVDEDEQDEAPQDDFSQFGGMPGMDGGMGGMPGMPGMGGMGGDFGGIDFSKLGGALGGDADGFGADGDDDDDEMPALEGDDEAEAKTDAPAAAAKADAPAETKA